MLEAEGPPQDDGWRLIEVGLSFLTLYIHFVCRPSLGDWYQRHTSTLELTNEWKLPSVNVPVRRMDLTAFFVFFRMHTVRSQTNTAFTYTRAVMISGVAVVSIYCLHKLCELLRQL